MSDTIHVKSALPANRDGGHPVALWERDDNHPNGEAYVAGPDPVEVAETAGVLEALAAGRLVKVSATRRERAAEQVRQANVEAVQTPAAETEPEPAVETEPEPAVEQPARRTRS